MYLFYLLAVLFAIIIIVISVFLINLKTRNYWRRCLADITPAPFSKDVYHIVNKYKGKDRVNSEHEDIELIVSYSLYGNYRKYAPTLFKNADIIREKYPTWQVRVYAAADVPPKIVEILTNKGAEVIVMGPRPPKGHEGALWRFLPASEETPFVSLDADDVISRYTIRKIKKWLRSGKRFCILNRYSFFVPIWAGLWGSRDRAIPDIKDRLDKYCEYWFGFDEAFLNKEIYPIVSKYGCWKSSTIPLDTFTLLAISIIGLLMILCLYLAYFRSSV